jgi:hypothetical protein
MPNSVPYLEPFRYSVTVQALFAAYRSPTHRRDGTSMTAKIGVNSKSSIYILSYLLCPLNVRGMFHHPRYLVLIGFSRTCDASGEI